MKQKCNRIEKNLPEIRKYYSNKKTWHEVQSNQDLNTLFSTLMKKLSPKIILLIGSDEDKQK